MADDVVKVPSEDEEDEDVLDHDLHGGPWARHDIVDTVGETSLNVLVEVAPGDLLSLDPLEGLLVHVCRALLDEGAEADRDGEGREEVEDGGRCANAEVGSARVAEEEPVVDIWRREHQLKDDRYQH